MVSYIGVSDILRIVDEMGSGVFTTVPRDTPNAFASSTVLSLASTRSKPMS